MKSVGALRGKRRFLEVARAHFHFDAAPDWRDMSEGLDPALRLANVQLEARYGRLVPDITCETVSFDGHARHHTGGQVR